MGKWLSVFHQFIEEAAAIIWDDEAVSVINSALLVPGPSIFPFLLLLHVGSINKPALVYSNRFGVGPSGAEIFPGWIARFSYDSSKWRLIQPLKNCSQPRGFGCSENVGHHSLD
jgi:hypothetical protein